MQCSIITVVYNDVENIERTIESVISQKNIDTEYIVIDGGSSDGTMDVVNRYKNGIDYIISEKDNGIYNAMNKGIKKATGDYVAFLNSGDWYEKDALSIVKYYFGRKDAEIVSGLANRVVEGISYGPVFDIKSDELWRFHINNLICHQSMFIKRSLFETIGLYNEKYKIMADYDWNLRAYISNVKFKLLSVSIVNFDVTGVSETGYTAGETREISLNWLNGHEEYREEIEKQYVIKNKLYSLFAKNKNKLHLKLKEDRSRFIIYGLGIYGLRVFRFLTENKYQVDYIIDKNRCGTVIKGIPIKYPNEKNTTQYLENHKDVKIIISSIKFYQEMKEQLLRMAVNNERIITLVEI